MIRLSRAHLATALKVKPRTIDAWVRRGHITRHPDGFDPAEVIAWWQNEDRQKMAALVSCRVGNTE